MDDSLSLSLWCLAVSVVSVGLDYIVNHSTDYNFISDSNPKDKEKIP